MKRKFKVGNYFWRSEAQKNGNIHFHILIDKYLHWRVVRDEWNNVQSKLGYIDEFEMKFGHRDPNSTDIHGLGKIENCTAYVVKYCCKTDGYRKIEGRIWGCSDSLKNIRPFETEIDSTVGDYIKAVIEEAPDKVIKKDSFTIIPVNNMRSLRKISPELFQRFQDHHVKIFIDLYHNRPIEPPIVKEVRRKPETEKEPVFIQLDFHEELEYQCNSFGKMF